MLNRVKKLKEFLEEPSESYVLVFLTHQKKPVFKLFSGRGKKKAGISPVVRRIRLRLGKGTKEFNIYETTLDKTNIPVYLIDKDLYFKREGIYGEKGKEYDDQLERFQYFSLAVLESLNVLNLAADIIGAWSRQRLNLASRRGSSQTWIEAGLHCGRS